MMTTGHALRSLAAGAICATILGSMVIMHAWPLWYGKTLVLEVVASDPRALIERWHVSLDSPTTHLLVGIPDPPPKDFDAEMLANMRPHVPVRAIGEFWPRLMPSSSHDGCGARRVFVQFRQREDATHAEPATISLDPIQGDMNLRGRIFCVPRSDEFRVAYDFERYLREQSKANTVETALREKRRVEMELAVASSGRARVRRLLVDGVAVEEPSRR